MNKRQTGKIISGNLKVYAVIILITFFLLSMYACNTSFLRSSYFVKEVTIADIIDGGKLYDRWWVETKGIEEPKNDHPLWKLQTTNKRKGSATWRCKECHGWDYKGKDGAYGTGSHKTGFPGIFGARNLSIKDIESILLGSTNPDHDFSNVFEYDSISKLAVFIKQGLVNSEAYIYNARKRSILADIENGKKLYNDKCIKCHDEDGRRTENVYHEKSDSLGSIANNNPWEFVHKVRFGTPGEGIMPSLRVKFKLSDDENQMPSGIDTGYMLFDVMDILEYSRSLPTE